MKYKKLLTRSFSGSKNSEMTTFAIIVGVTVGAVVGALFATSKGKMLRKRIACSVENMAQHFSGNTRKKANTKLGNLIVDVRHHVKQNAEGLRGNDIVLNPLG